MDPTSVTGIAALATAMSQERLAAEVGTLVLRKALDAEAAGVLALLNALPRSPLLPDNLGRNVDTVA
jgi:hypothetical protein